MRAKPSRLTAVIKEKVPSSDRAAVALYANFLLNRDPELRFEEAARQAVEAYRRDPDAVRTRDGSPPKTPPDMRERIWQLFGGILIGGIALYAFITESWWVFFVGDGLLLLLGAVAWLRTRGSA
jgi:hypothetical protein